MQGSWKEAWDELEEFVEHWSKAYPEECFVPLPPYKEGEQISRDRVSGQMGRHVTRCILEKMKEIAEA